MSAKLEVWFRKKAKTKFYIGRFYITSDFNTDNSKLATQYYKQIKNNECIVTFRDKDSAQFKKLKSINDISHLPFYLTVD